MNNTTATPSKREWHGSHHSWSYHQQAFRWLGERIAGLNILPLAGDMRAWMQQRGQLALMPAPTPPSWGGFTNPYTTSGVTLQLLMARAINAAHEYATTDTPDHNEVDAEVERVRLYNEVLLYSARLCEVAIKQLLYCTQIPETRYGRMALGALLESPCPDCKRHDGKKPHLVSLVGTLAHPFHLCLEFEHCAMDHMALVNRLRNSEAAHSGIQPLNIRSVEESKLQLMQDNQEVLEGFLHMLSHLEDLEHQMLRDLTEKGESINALKKNGLRPEDCNFNLVPGEKFVFAP
ncbi:hypothetical protein [Pseudomonas sp. EA_35y_Pfl2_R5]|uniref:hypothetical protein n=1 Tax=Pseudomonas sp. EA_35y_Pfl2_R5 TaxID=3088690 RepID=UPI0030DC1140